MRRAALALLALAGCERLLGIPSPSHRGDDGGEGVLQDAAAGPDGAASEQIRIASATIHHLESGDTVARPDDPATVTIEAFRLTEEGFTEPIPAALVDAEAGTYLIEGIPPGQEYYVRYSYFTTANQYLVTTARSLDLGSDVFGRPDPDVASPGTAFVFDVGSMTPWKEGDSFLLVSANAGGASGQLLSRPPEVDSTSVADLAIDWTGLPLVKTSLGDTLRLLHLTNRPVGDLVGQVVADQHLVQASIDQADGEETALQGSFSLVPASNSKALAWRLADLTGALATGGGPAYAEVRSSLTIGPGQTTSALLLGLVTSVETDLNLGVVMYGNPFPGSLEPFLSVSVNRAVVLQVEGAEPKSYRDAYTPWIDVFERVSDTPRNLRAQVHPPVDVRVNGQALDGVPPAISATVSLDEPVVVTWAPHPDSRNPPTFYRARLFALFPSESGTGRRRIMSIETRSPGFTVPPGILEPGLIYNLLVTAQFSPNADEAAPKRLTIPKVEAQIVTGLFETEGSPPADAGSGGGGT